MSTSEGLSAKQDELIKLVSKIGQERRSAGKKIFRDTREFILHLLILAEQSKCKMACQEKIDAQQKALKHVGSAVRKLLEALTNLDKQSRDELEKEQREIFRAARSMLDGDLSDEYDLEGQAYKSRSLWLQEEDLIWQSQATERLTQKSKGRRPDAAEKWTATEFAVICHRSGWSQIPVASNNDNGRHSDAIRCLAAVFEVAGVPGTRALSKAYSALRSMRKPKIYVEECSTSNDYSESICYDLNLTEMSCEIDKRLSKLPRFIPDGLPVVS